MGCIVRSTSDRCFQLWPKPCQSTH
jgi:hypothetical protein